MGKVSPQRRKLEEILRSSKIVAGGFLGTDSRSLEEIIEEDQAQLARLGITPDHLIEKMQQITDMAIQGLGTWVQIDPKRSAKTDEAKGSLICPWPHPGKFAKRITTVKLTETDQTLRWSDLNIHLIAKHNFFQGRGSQFRIDPEKIVEFIL